MAELIFSSAEVTQQFTSTVIVRMYAHIYVEYTISNSPGSATITASVKGRVGQENDSYADWYNVSLVLHNPSSTSSTVVGRWRLNNDTTTSLITISKDTITSSTITLSQASKAAPITKTHSPQSIPVYVRIEIPSYLRYSKHTTSGTTISNKELSSISTIQYITIPARDSYPVTYNANGGQNAPSNQTKWYGEALTLKTAPPEKDGYTFKGWATSVEHASAGTVDYVAGASYTGNAALTLYAVWELTYQKPPIIQNVSIERCVQDGTLDDEGTYALVSFDWAVFRSTESRYYGGNTYPYADNSVETCTITVGTQSATPTLTGASGHDSAIVGVGSYDVDKAYNATVSITDSQEISTDNTTTVSGALPMTFFPLDYNEDATALGIFMPAPDNGSGAYFAKEVTLKSKLYIELDDNVGSGTDYEIIQALTALNWSDLLS